MCVIAGFYFRRIEVHVHTINDPEVQSSRDAEEVSRLRQEKFQLPTIKSSY